MSSPSSSNDEGNNAWLMKIELKREEPMEINKAEGIKKATETKFRQQKTSFNPITIFFPQLRSKLSR